MTRALWFLCLMAVVAFVYAVFPDIDLKIAGLFYQNGHFPTQRAFVAEKLRTLGFVVPYALLGALTLAYLAKRMGWVAARFAPTGRSVIWLALSLALGPGLLVNVVLKEQSHRPRPVQVQEFGGPWAFKPFYRFDGACKSNCSFVSGEAASSFWTLAPASLAPAPFKLPAMAAATVFAFSVSGLRMAFGGHFSSDVLFAALFTLGIALALHRLLIPRENKT